MASRRCIALLLSLPFDMGLFYLIIITFVMRRRMTRAKQMHRALIRVKSER